jgi:AcrR family transcriptional regulator
VARSPKDDADKKQSARNRIMAAAEDLFAAKGLHGASLREIARKAEINVNLISYYFAEKEDLYDAVVDTRAAQLNDARAISLDALEDRYSPEPVPVAEIIHSLIHPFFALRAKDPSGWDNWILLLDRETGTELFSRAMARNLAVVLRRYLYCLHRSVPNADRADLLFVLELATRAMVLGSEWDMSAIVPDENLGKAHYDQAENRIVRTLSAAALSFNTPAATDD